MITRPKHGGNLTWAAQVADCSPQQILDFSASISPLGPPSSVLSAIQTNLSSLGQYPDPGYRQLRATIAEYHGIDPDWILPGNGSAELLTWAGRDFSFFQGCCGFTPAFSDYQRALASYGIGFEGLSLLSAGSQFGKLWVPWASLREMASRDWGLLVNNPHNPTGLLFEQGELEPFLDHFGMIVIDEAFMDFLPPDHQQSLIRWIGQFPNLVVLRSLTKFYSLPGLRLGYGVGHPDRLRRWQRWRDPWSVNSLAAVATIAALTDTDFQQMTWSWVKKAREDLFVKLRSHPALTPFPSQANFLLVAYSGSVTTLQTLLLKQYQIYIRDCLSFPELGDRFFRVAVRTIEDNDRLVAALRALA